MAVGDTKMCPLPCMDELRWQHLGRILLGVWNNFHYYITRSVSIWKSSPTLTLKLIAQITCFVITCFIDLQCSGITIFFLYINSMPLIKPILIQLNVY